MKISYLEVQIYLQIIGKIRQLILQKLMLNAEYYHLSNITNNYIALTRSSIMLPKLWESFEVTDCATVGNS